MLPVVVIGLLYDGSTKRWPISLLLWSITFGHTEKRLYKLQMRFIKWFRKNMTIFPIVQKRLYNYINNDTFQVWLITGSPINLVEQVYYDAVFFPKVNIIGSRIEHGYGGLILILRCLGKEKLLQLEHKLGKIPMKLYSGYSDSFKDKQLLLCCKHRWRVTNDGKIQPLGQIHAAKTWR